MLKFNRNTGKSMDRKCEEVTQKYVPSSVSVFYCPGWMT